MKKRNLKPTQTAPVERPQSGSTSRDPLAMFAAGGGVVAAIASYSIFSQVRNTNTFHSIPFAGDDAE